MTLRILVTGGAGFIGSHLCERLVADGHEVAALDNLYPNYPSRIKLKNISALRKNSRFKFFRQDVRNSKKLSALLSRLRPNLVVHLAAMVGVRESMDKPALYEDVNVKGTQNLLEACQKTGVRKFIFASSSSVYGNDARAPFKESDKDIQPVSPYAVTKKAGEALCHAYAELYQMDVCVLRFFTVYGPRQRPDLAIHKFTKGILAGKPIPVYGDGSTSRDYTFVGDIIKGMLGAIRWTMSGSARGRFEIFNLGGSKPVSLKELIQQLEAVTGRKAKIKKMAEQPGDVRSTCADISKSCRILGYKPETGLEVGLKVFFDWYQT